MVKVNKQLVIVFGTFLKVTISFVKIRSQEKLFSLFGLNVDIFNQNDITICTINIWRCLFVLNLFLGTQIFSDILSFLTNRRRPRWRRRRRRSWRRWRGSRRPNVEKRTNVESVVHIFTQKSQKSQNGLLRLSASKPSEILYFLQK